MLFNKPVHFSISKSILELAFFRLKDSGFLFYGQEYYSEIKKNTLKDFLKNEWKWEKKQVIHAIKVWRDSSLLESNGDSLVFKFTQVVKTDSIRIKGIGNDNY